MVATIRNYNRRPLKFLNIHGIAWASFTLTKQTYCKAGLGSLDSIVVTGVYLDSSQEPLIQSINMRSCFSNS